MTHRTILIAAALGASLSALSAPAFADEGMWTFDNFPADRMKRDHGWVPDQKWLDRSRAAAVRLTGGCSASFVSGEGLILTNQHCVATCLANLSSEGKDYLAQGFRPATRSEERPCPGQQAEVVTMISDVTGDIKNALGSLSGGALIKARDARIAELEASGCPDKDKTRCQVVTLYGGGKYSLYTYRKYSDVRIAWAPEGRAQGFGGDPDNFNFPRYALDGSFLRAYENGKPVKPAAFLKWNPRAPVAGETTFVIGNPGSTSRLWTSSQLAFEREARLPMTIATLSELRGRFIRAMSESALKRSEGQEELDGLENSLKVYLGRQKALNDPDFVARLAATEAQLKAGAATNPAIGDPWASVDSAMAANRKLYLASRFVRPTGGLYGWARALVRAAAERTKPDGERLPGYTSSALPLTEKTILDPTPVHGWVEQIYLEWSLSKAREWLGADDADTRLLLGRESPEGLAGRLVTGTSLGDPAVRKALWDGGQAAVEASSDPMILFARKLDARDRELTRLANAEVNGPLVSAGAKLADARFATFGAGTYPDATFSLRISYGKVAGWTERGVDLNPVTTIGGTFDRATGAAPFDLPAAFAANEAKIDKSVVYNFVTTNDIIGGNSGSPVLDKAGTVIGAAFDGNIHSLGGNYGYDGTLNRTVVVSAAALTEAMRSIYPSPALLAELGVKSSKKR
ncbi:S46 family peptidase [Novosphingobium sp.]|uniref:S46 family peptidase n=1 Tax=Novosphingobium sp. TaxID=1874826 RepID=UPI0025EDF926|nr:S46 family peptidase [Novosphingobium sp.]